MPPASISGARPLGNCPTCQVPYLSAGSPDRFSCPICGRHASPAGPAAPTAPAPTASGVSRREEEMLAAWMIGQPVPCPRCRTSLRRVALGQFACPSCGTRATVPEIGRRSSGKEPGRPEEFTVVEGAGHPLDVPAQGTVGGERGH